nr:hypothetical protein [Tanacetum cinerariifolium]
MITDEMKLTENYWIYDAVFRVDVPKTQSQSIESTQGTHRTSSAPRIPNPDIAEGESSASRKFTVIRLRIPQRRSTRLTPPTPITATDEADDIVLQDTMQLSLAEQKSHEELKAKQNKEKVKEHLMAEEIEKQVEGTKNIEENKVDSSTLRQNDNQNDLDARLEPRSNKESPGVEITAAVQPVNVNKEEEEPSAVRPRDQDDPHDDAHLEGENSAKRQKTSEHETYVFRESSSGQVNESDPGPSTSGNKKQLEDFDFWMDSYATDDDELPTEKVSQELV